MSRLGPLAERNFRLLFLARTASEIGSAIAPVALAFAVLDELDGSATDLGLVLAAASVPQIVFLLIAGVWADRLPRNLVLVGSDLTMFAAQATLATLLITDRAELWHLLVTQAFRGTAQAFFYPASTGLVPQTISAPLLQQANALLRLSHSSTGVLGAAGGGALVAAFGAPYAIALDALTFLVSAAMLVRIRLPRRATVAVRNFARELREGWDEFWSRTWLWVIVLAALVDNAVFSGTFSVLGPVIAKEELGGAAAWGAILGALRGRLRRRRDRHAPRPAEPSDARRVHRAAPRGRAARAPGPRGERRARGGGRLPGRHRPRGVRRAVGHGAPAAHPARTGSRA